MLTSRNRRDNEILTGDLFLSYFQGHVNVRSAERKEPSLGNRQNGASQPGLEAGELPLLPTDGEKTE